MQKHVIRCLALATAVGLGFVVGCRPKSESEPAESRGLAERTGAAVDRAADRTADAVQTTGEAAKDLTGRAVQRTGEAMENAGESMERTGADMQSKPATTVKE